MPQKEKKNNKDKSTNYLNKKQTLNKMNVATEVLNACTKTDKGKKERKHK